MSQPYLAEIEQLAAAQGLLLRLQVRRWLAITGLRVVVARQRPDQPPLLVGELKGWALPLPGALQLDTMRGAGPEDPGRGCLDLGGHVCLGAGGHPLPQRPLAGHPRQRAAASAPGALFQALGV